MAKLEDVHGLELPVNMRLQVWTWRAERAGWLLMALVLAAAGAGLAGPGPLNRTRVRDLDGRIALEYPRVVRKGAAFAMSVTTGPGAARGGRLRLRLDGDHLRSARLEGMVPEPAAASAAGDSVLFEFASADGPARVLFRLHPESAGVLRGSLSLEDGAGVDFRQVVLP